jgi:hypothetical protein
MPRHQALKWTQSAPRREASDPTRKKQSPIRLNRLKSTAVRPAMKAAIAGACVRRGRAGGKRTRGRSAEGGQQTSTATRLDDCVRLRENDPMTTTAIVLLATYLALAGLMYARAERSLRHRAKLPMQWGLNRQPTWYAPRHIALIVTPILGGIGFLAAALIAATEPQPPSVTTNEVVGLLVGLGALGLAVYAGYLWLLARWDRATSGVLE